VIVYKSIFAKRTHLRIKPDPTKSDQIKPNQTKSNHFLPAVMLAAPKWHSRFLLRFQMTEMTGMMVVCSFEFQTLYGTPPISK
jgi:hypothetical protein